MIDDCFAATLALTVSTERPLKLLSCSREKDQFKVAVIEESEATTVLT